MRYQALLFCPDDKTARVVTQVLSELEFQVECCNEPFAAVKKLMAQHFDAIVVDCENEQNASLLFKSARNSGSNASALSVAVVEGQAGVDGFQPCAKGISLAANFQTRFRVSCISSTILGRSHTKSRTPIGHYEQSCARTNWRGRGSSGARQRSCRSGDRTF